MKLKQTEADRVIHDQRARKVQMAALDYLEYTVDCYRRQNKHISPGAINHIRYVLHSKISGALSDVDGAMDSSAEDLPKTTDGGTFPVIE